MVGRRPALWAVVAAAWGRNFTVPPQSRRVPHTQGQTLVFSTGVETEGRKRLRPSVGPKRRSPASSAVALLELLAGAAPAGVVAADVLAVRLDDRLRRAGGRGRAARECHRRGSR